MTADFEYPDLATLGRHTEVAFLQISSDSRVVEESRTGSIWLCLTACMTRHRQTALLSAISADQSKDRKEEGVVRDLMTGAVASISMLIACDHEANQNPLRPFVDLAEAKPGSLKR